MKPTTKAYREGWAAYSDGQTQQQNPYQIGSNDWLEWDEGWKQARMLEVHR